MERIFITYTCTHINVHIHVHIYMYMYMYNRMCFVFLGSTYCPTRLSLVIQSGFSPEMVSKLSSQIWTEFFVWCANSCKRTWNVTKVRHIIIYNMLKELKLHVPCFPFNAHFFLLLNDLFIHSDILFSWAMKETGWHLIFNLLIMKLGMWK